LDHVARRLPTPDFAKALDSPAVNPLLVAFAASNAAGQVFRSEFSCLAVHFSVWWCNAKPGLAASARPLEVRE
jgi:hypothetical protein